MFNIKFIDLFAGIGGFHTGLTHAGHECVAFSEIDKAATKSYKAMYDPNNKLAYFPDVTKFSDEQAEEFKDVEIITAGFPCFAEGTLITTINGLKKIEDIQTNDLVLTHTNTFKKVVVPMVKHKKGIYHLELQGMPETFVTEEHPYYVREKRTEWNNFNGRFETHYSEPKWVAVKDLDKQLHVIGLAKNMESENPYDLRKYDSYLLGKKLDERIPDNLLSYPVELLEKVLEGYSEMNGYQEFISYIIHTKSKEIAYTLGQIIQKVYNTTYDITYEESNERYEVVYTKLQPLEDNTVSDDMIWKSISDLTYDSEWEGNVYNFEVAEDNSYVANNATVHNCQSFSVGGKKLGMKDDRGLLFLEVVRLTNVIKPKYVIMENVKGLLSNRSTLDDEAGLEELKQAIQTFQENNGTKLTPKTEYSTFITNLSYYAEQLLGSDESIDAFIKQDFVSSKLYKGVKTFECGTFNIIVNKFSEIGYNLEWRVFNSSDFGVSQSRERVYIVAHRREAATEPFLLSIGTHRRASDFREEEENSQRKKHNVDVIPIINPGFRKKKINGRIFKEPNEDMYTITKIGNHGFLLVSKDEFPNAHKGEFSDKLHQMFELSDYNNEKDLYYTSRKITPLEAWKLMGYEEELFNAASLVNRDPALYQQAGNSITPQIVYNIGLLLEE